MHAFFRFHNLFNMFNVFFVYTSHRFHFQPFLPKYILQTRQPIFVQLLQSAFRVSQCPWLAASQRFNVENCIRTLSEVG